MRLGRNVADLDGRHQSAFGVIENVAVDHPVAGSIVEADQKLQRLLERHADRVFPLQRSDRNSWQNTISPLGLPDAVAK